MNTKLNFSKEDITFNGTENEKKLKEELFDSSLLIAQKDDEIKELKNIIKEVREELNKIDGATYQGDTDKKTYYKYEQTRIKKLLEILDKENKELESEEN